MTPMAIFLSLPMPSAKLSISSPPLSAASKVMTSTSSLSKIGQRLRVKAPLRLRPLRGGVAPAGVTPHLCLLAQASHLAVEGLDQKIARHLLIIDADHAVDRRFLHLDNGAPGVGQLNQLLVHGRRERHDQVAPVLVVHIVNTRGYHLAGDRTELDGFAGLPLRHFPYPRIFERSAMHVTRHVRQHARLEHFEHDVAGGLVTTGCGAAAPDVVAFETLQSFGGVGEPRASADVAVAACIAVGQQIEAGARLVGEIGRYRIGVLLAEGNVGHRHRERPPLQVCKNQCGRGSDPVMVVSNGRSFETVSIGGLRAAASALYHAPAEPQFGWRRPALFLRQGGAILVMELIARRDTACRRPRDCDEY